MEYVNTSPFQHVLDLFEQMSFEDQATLTELLYHRLTEYRRMDIAHNATMALQAIQNRKAQQGSLEDFKREMLREV